MSIPGAPEDPDETPAESASDPAAPAPADDEDTSQPAPPGWEVIPPAPYPVNDAPVPPPPPPATPAPAFLPPPPVAKSGPGKGVGVGIGCGAHVLGLVLMFLVGSMLPSPWIPVNLLWPFILILIVSLALLVPPATRRVGAGMTIVSAAIWIIVIGPCIALLSGV